MKKILSILIISAFIYAQPSTIVAASKINVSVFPTEIDQLGKYVISATNGDGTPFTGTLQTQYWLCPLDATSHTSPGCSTMTTNTFSIPSSGKAVQNLAYYPDNYSPAIKTGKYFIQWKPTSDIFDWSNETVIAVTPLDMKRYFNLTNGNYYRYNANNLRMNQTIGDATRVDIKNETYCENTNSMFFSKTSKYAYWNPSYDTNDIDSLITTSNFMVWRPKWNEKGELETKTWSHYHPSSLPTNLDIFPNSGFTYETFVNSSYQLGIKTDSSSLLTPYVYTTKSLDINQYGGPDGSNWYFTDEVRFGSYNKQSATNETDYKTKFCDVNTNGATTATFRTLPIMKYYAKIIDTPAYKGPVAVVVMREPPKYTNCSSISSFPNNCPKVLREDWFMAKDIGLVGFEVKNFGGIYNAPPSPGCADDPDCQKDGLMNNPYVRQQVTSYHVSYPREKYLTFTNETSHSRTFNLHVNRNDFSDLNFFSQLHQVQLVVDDDANWDNGYGTRIMINLKDNGPWKNANLIEGSYYVYEKELGMAAPTYGWQTSPVSSEYTNTTSGFKVRLAGLLYDGEDLEISISEDDGAKGFSLANNMYVYFEGQNGVHGTLPLFAQGQESYQNYTFAKIGQFIPPPLPLPGDLNGDGHVDIFDYNLLVSKFGNPYTIFDYNALVGNFGK